VSWRRIWDTSSAGFLIFLPASGVGTGSPELPFPQYATAGGLVAGNARHQVSTSIGHRAALKSLWLCRECHAVTRMFQVGPTVIFGRIAAGSSRGPCVQRHVCRCLPYSAKLLSSKLWYSPKAAGARLVVGAVAASQQFRWGQVLRCWPVNQWPWWPQGDDAGANALRCQINNRRRVKPSSRRSGRRHSYQHAFGRRC